MTARPSPQPVVTPGTLGRVPNQPKTPIRGFRIPDDTFLPAKRIAAGRGESLSAVVRAALERYVRRYSAKERP